MINSKNLDPNKIKIKDLKYVTINSVNPLYLAISKINRYIKKINENKYLTIDPADESKDTLKKYEEPQTKIGNLIRSKTNYSDDYDKKYMKTKFNSDDDLPLIKKLELRNLILVVRAVFHENK